MTPIYILSEDLLSESILKHIILNTNSSFSIAASYGKKGRGYLRGVVAGFNNIAKYTPVVLLTDLDNVPCVVDLIRDWINFRLDSRFIFQISVREVEAWLLADQMNFARYIGIASKFIPSDVETIPNPKDTILQLVKKSRFRRIKKDILPENSSSKVGPGYNVRLIEFVNSHWDLQVARTSSRSLERLVLKLSKLI